MKDNNLPVNLSALQLNIIDDLMSMKHCIHSSIFDVGAVGGFKKGPLSILKDARSTNLVSFEASSTNGASSFDSWYDTNHSLLSQNHIDVPFLAGNFEGKTIFNTTEEPRCSSILTPNIKELSQYHDTARFAISEKSWLPVTTIDNVVSRLSWLPLIIKCDAQGYDLKVLEGASNSIKLYRPWILVEMNCIDYYSQQSSIGDTSNFLETHDYHIINIYPAYHYLVKPGKGPKIINFFDALWIPRNSSYIGNISEVIKDLILEVSFSLCFTNKTLEKLRLINRPDLWEKIKTLATMIADNDCDFYDHKA